MARACGAGRLHTWARTAARPRAYCTAASAWSIRCGASAAIMAHPSSKASPAMRVWAWEGIEWGREEVQSVTNK